MRVVEAGDNRGAGPQPLVEPVEVPPHTLDQSAWAGFGEFARGRGGEAAAGGACPDARAYGSPTAEVVGRVEGAGVDECVDMARRQKPFTL